METVIYLDVLIAVNIFVTYILLVSVRVILKMDTNKWGLVLASFIGGASSLIIFYEEIPLLISILYKTIVGVVISFSAFLPKTKKLFFKTTFSFFFVNFIFGGVMYFIEITFNINNVIYMNGTIYFDISVAFLVSVTLISYGLLLLSDYFLKRRASENTLYDAEIYYRNKKTEVKAFYDTGNHLTDGLIGKPVVVVNLKCLRSFFDLVELDYLENGLITDEIPGTLKREIRLIPCSSVVGSSVLKGFTPQKIVIKSKNVQFETTYLILAVTNEELSNGEYDCILNSMIFERGQKINYEKVNK